MTTSISLTQVGSPDAQGQQLAKDIYAQYKAAERCHLKGGDATFIPYSLCRLRVSNVRGSGIRDKRVKQALQPAMAAHEAVLELLIRLLFSTFTGYPLCLFARSLSEESRVKLVIQEIVNIHDQIASGAVTDCTLMAELLCYNFADALFILGRLAPYKLNQEDFGSILDSYGVPNLDTPRKRQAYVSYRATKHPTRSDHIPDHDLRRVAIYFLMDPNWSRRKEVLLHNVRRLCSNDSSK